MYSQNLLNIRANNLNILYIYLRFYKFSIKNLKIKIVYCTKYTKTGVEFELD